MVRGVDSAATHLEGAAAACSFGAAVRRDLPWLPVIRSPSPGSRYTSSSRATGISDPRPDHVRMSVREHRHPQSGRQHHCPCPAHKAAAVDAIRSLEPDLVVVANTYEPWLRGEPGLDDGAVRYAAGQRSVIEEFARPDLPVFVLAAPPPGLAPEECATTLSTPADCISGIPDDWRNFNDGMADRLAGMPTTTLRRHLLLVLLVGRSVSEFRRAYPGPPRRRRPCGAGLRPTPGPVARADHAHLNLRLRTRCCHTNAVDQPVSAR